MELDDRAHEDVRRRLRRGGGPAADEVTNLLAGAARYCHAGDRVRLRARAEHGEAVLGITDTGPGNPPDDQTPAAGNRKGHHHGTD